MLTFITDKSPDYPSYYDYPWPENIGVIDNALAVAIIEEIKAGGTVTVDFSENDTDEYLSLSVKYPACLVPSPPGAERTISI